MSPYRTPPTNDPAVLVDGADVSPDGDLLPGLALVWLVSIARVVLAVMHRETNGTEPALAALAVFVLPYMMRDAIAWWLRRCSRARRP